MNDVTTAVRVGKGSESQTGRGPSRGRVRRLGFLDLDRNGRRFIIIPWVALRYFGISLLLLLILAFAAELLLWRECSLNAINCPKVTDLNQFTNLTAADRHPSSMTSPLWVSPGVPFPPASPGRKRILVVGDSFVYGDGFRDINLVWWRQLHRELQRRGYWNADVVAFGANGASTQDEGRWIADRKLMDAIRPDLIVLGYVTNDPDIVGEDGRRLIPQYHGVNPRLCLPQWQRTALGWAPRLLFKLGEMCAERDLLLNQGDAQGWGYSSWERQLLRSDNLNSYAGIVRSLANSSRDSGIQLVAVAMAQQLYVPPIGDPPNPALAKDANSDIDENPQFSMAKAIFEQAGIPWWNLYPAFARRFGHAILETGQEPPGLFISPANGHPGPLLTHFYATEVADRLEREHQDALGERRPAPPDLAPKINDWLPTWLDVRQTGPAEWSFSPGGPIRPAFDIVGPGRQAIMSFELPVLARHFEFRGATQFRISLWAYFIDESDGHVGVEPVALGSAEGPVATIAIPPELRLRRLSSLLVRAEPYDQSVRFDWQKSLDVPAIAKDSGAAYVVALGKIPFPGDTSGNGPRSDLVLLEDGRPLGPSHAVHAVIRSEGNGAYSHWGEALYFSANDNSDPRVNGRSYTLAHVRAPERIDMKITFQQPAVAP